MCPSPLLRRSLSSLLAILLRYGFTFFISVLFAVFFSVCHVFFFSFKFFPLVLIDFLSLSHSTDGPYIPLCFKQTAGTVCHTTVYTVYVCIAITGRLDLSTRTVKCVKSPYCTYIFSVNNHIATCTTVNCQPAPSKYDQML